MSSRSRASTREELGDRSSSAFDIEPLPPPYQGTIRTESEREHSPLTVPSVGLTLSRSNMVTPPPVNRGQKSSSVNRYSNSSDERLRRHVVAEACEKEDPLGRDTAPHQRWLAQQMRRLTLQIHHFASDPHTDESDSPTAPELEVGYDSCHDEEKKTDDDDNDVDHRSFTGHAGAQDSVELAWSSLENAVQMVIEHCRLAQEEAKESQQGQVHAIVYKERALAAEGLNKQMQEELSELKDRAGKLSRERKVLVREVKSLRRQLEQSEQKNVWRQVESYVVRALSVHESQLTRRKADTESDRSLTSRTDSDDGFSATTRSALSVDVHDETADRQQGQDGSHYVVVAPCQSLDEPQEEHVMIDARKSVATDKHLDCGPSPALDASAVPATATNPPQAASTPVVRASLGFGGHVALGFGRTYGKARQSITPKAVPSQPAPLEDPVKSELDSHQLIKSHLEAPSDTAGPSNSALALTKSVDRVVPQQNTNPFTGYRSRVNSGELFGSSVKKFLQNGSHSLAGAISTATGRTSPLMSAGDAATKATALSSEGTPQHELESGCGDNKGSSSKNTFSETSEACTDSPVHSTSCSVPGDIVANPSKDVSCLGSPVLLTPSLESPATGSSLMLFELDCDPRILRSLSLPFVVRRDPADAGTALADAKETHGSVNDA